MENFKQEIDLSFACAWAIYIAKNYENYLTSHSSSDIS